MKRFFHLVLGGMAMIAIALLFAFVTIRIAIHGTQVEVPNLAGLTVAEARDRVDSRGLNLLLVSRFYSTTIPAGHILSQVPVPGVIVRKEWEVRAIESLGPQKVSIPDVHALPERVAAITIRRVSLDLGTLAHLPAPGDAEVVLAQTPPPNAGGVDSPRVSLLLSQKDDLRPTFVMPSLVGLSAATAAARAAALGLNLTEVSGQPAATPAPEPGTAAPRTVTNQLPLAGHRIAQGDTIRLTIGGTA